MEYRHFNINENVKVRLTPFGHQMLKANYNKLFLRTPNGIEYLYNHPYTAPQEDEEGWSKWQMWTLMEELGEYCGMGYKLPFETTIQIIIN